MSAAVAFGAFYVVIPIIITALLFGSRKELWRTIVILSIISLAAEGINIVLWILRISPGFPISLSNTITFGDTARLLASGLAEYLGATAWVICILVTAQQRRIVWAFILTVVAITSIVSLYVVDHPYAFFSLTGYSGWLEVLLLVFTHFITVLTLIFGLLIKPRQAATPSPPAFNASPPTPPTTTG